MHYMHPTQSTDVREAQKALLHQMWGASPPPRIVRRMRRNEARAFENTV